MTKALAPRLAAEPDTLCRHEMGITAGFTRTDVALIGTNLEAYEIKSDSDSLTRLPAQVKAYGKVMDRATLVTTPLHLNKATALIPHWWGIILAETAGLTHIRPSEPNKGQSPYSLAQLLWRAEALQDLRDRNCHKPLAKADRHYIWLRLAQVTTLDELRTTVSRHMRARDPAEWTGGQPKAAK